MRGEKTEFSNIDLEIIKRYAGLIRPSQLAIAVGCRPDTFYKILQNPNHEASKVYTDAKIARVNSIARLKFEEALNGDSKAMEFYLTRMGGWVEKQELEATVTSQHSDDFSPKRIADLFNEPTE